MPDVITEHNFATPTVRIVAEGVPEGALINESDFVAGRDVRWQPAPPDAPAKKADAKA